MRRKTRQDDDGGGGSGGSDVAAAERALLEQNRKQAEAAGKMMAAGVNPAQLSAYTGIKLVQLEEGFQPTLQVTPSHLFVDRDKEGACDLREGRGRMGADARVFAHPPTNHPIDLSTNHPPNPFGRTRTPPTTTGDLKQARFVYVDEYACIGCTNCAHVAPNTFYMEDGHGRARVFQQWKDRPTIVQTAIETCPVDCIHYVPFEELERLEQERERMVINYKARLVGPDGLLSSGGAELGGYLPTGVVCLLAIGCS